LQRCMNGRFQGHSRCGRLWSSPASIRYAHWRWRSIQLKRDTPQTYLYRAGS
jgi:hypothetical protein